MGKDIKNLVIYDAFNDFYSTTVKMFPNLGRELEVDDGPEHMFKNHQSNITTCSEPGIT